TWDGDLLLTGCQASWGGMLDNSDLREEQVLPVLGALKREQLAHRAPGIGKGELFWREVFTKLAPVELPYPQQAASPRQGAQRLIRATLGLPARGSVTVAAFFAWLSALTGQTRVSVMYSDELLEHQARGLESWLSPWVPLTLETLLDAGTRQAAAQAAVGLAQVHQAGPCSRDFPFRLGARPGTGERWGKVGLCLRGNSAPPVALDLVLTADPADQTLELMGDEAVFSRETLQLMASHFACYLRAFQSAEGVAQITLLPPAEAALIAAGNATEEAYDAGLSIDGLIAAQAASTPERPALSFRGHRLPYRELERQATALAGRLRQRGVRPGDIVGVSLERGPALVVSLLAVFKAGAAYLPLDPDYPHDRLLYMIEDSGAPLVITSRAVTAVLAIPPDKVFLADEPNPATAPAPLLAASAAPAAGPRPAYLIYTSGSTGRPKGVVITHQNLLNLFAGLDARIPHQPPGRWLAETSFSFDISVLELWWSLARGFTVVLHSTALPHVSIADAVLQGEVTHLQCTPSMASMLVADAAGRQALSRLAVLMVGGEALSFKLATELRTLVPGAVFNMYGPTETTVWSTIGDLARMDDFVPLGQPIANTQLSVRTPAGAECPALVAGELLIGGDGVSQGYWQRPELTAARFVTGAGLPASRFYRTGDLVRRHPGGEIEFLGRIDHQVKIRGHRIELGEIESVLLHQEGVKDAVVVAREEAPGDWRLAAYVTAQAGSVLDTGRLRDDLAGLLPDIMVPRTLMVLRALPMTPNGKVDRKALPVRPQGAEASSPRPQTQAEQQVAAIWEQVLGQPVAAASDNFFALGGSFLLAAQVQRQLRQACGLKVPLPELIRFPTVQALAAHLASCEPCAAGAERQEAGRPARTHPGAALPAAGQPAQEVLTPVEVEMARLWRDLLGIAQIGRQDDFFELGGHSLTAVRLFTQLQKQFAVDLPLATLFQASSLAGFSAIVAASCGSAANTATAGAALPELRQWSPLVCICPGLPGQTPLFCVHGAGGNVLNFKPVALRLGPEQPFYGLQAQGVDGRLPPLESIEAMAEQYVQAIRSVSPEGPYQLLGYCAGGVIAFEMAQQLRRAGQQVSWLGMVDTLSPTAVERRPSFLRKLWLMRHWSPGFIMSRARRRHEGELLDASYAQLSEKFGSDESLKLEYIEYHLFRNFLAAQKRYRPEPYPDALVMFRATQEAGMACLHAGKSLGWQAHVQGSIRVLDMASTHLFMLQEPGLSQLVDALRHELAGIGLPAAVHGQRRSWRQAAALPALGRLGKLLN
ncbi:MAG: amino acid adenylation domain protein, partial [Polaromonas sp.]|nr:amino acid adenylation domain protein [Polaromonas sp.]